MNVSSCHSMPLNALAPCLNLCSILRHMASLRWPSSRSHQPISTSLEVRTCHLSKSCSLLHNSKLCAITGETHKHCLDKTWENMGGGALRRITANKHKAREENDNSTHCVQLWRIMAKYPNLQSNHCLVWTRVFMKGLTRLFELNQCYFSSKIVRTDIWKSKILLGSLCSAPIIRRNNEIKEKKKESVS